jgi:O-antigen biosynthesis protein
VFLILYLATLLINSLQVSIVIVNYNVKYFLEQCLYSLCKSLQDIAAEVIVVDNNSTDGSTTYLKERFPEAVFIENKRNEGFSKACNQGAQIARGDFILFLNPDTILPEDCISKCIHFLNSNNNAGALGVRMIDGQGKFLKESKRSFPSPLTSLFKLFGLSRLFPTSKLFAKYHLGHLEELKTNEVDVLAGAFMMIKKEVGQKVGLFDEQFFMYGEDIDLSYRIQQAEYKNYYFADTTIIHFKGESTRRGSLNYLRMFYNAMSIFVHKHYGGARAGIFNFLIQVAILFRALVSATAKFVKNIGLPVVDAAIILLSFTLVKEFWIQFVRPEIVYPEGLLLVLFPMFTIVYLIAAYYAGLYNKYYRVKDLTRSTLIATLILLAVYALLPEKYRFSRGILSIGAVCAFLLIHLNRWIMLQKGMLLKQVDDVESPFIFISGTGEEYDNIAGLLKENKIKNKVIGRVAINDNNDKSLGSINEVEKLAPELGAKELIFCAGEMKYADIIYWFQKFNKLRLRIHKTRSGSIVGSDSSGDSGQVIAADAAYNLSKPTYKRIKRLIDVILAIFLLVTTPFHFIFHKHPVQLLKNAIIIVWGKKTWVSYFPVSGLLPPLRNGVLTPNGLPSSASASLPAEHLQQVNKWYAKSYDPLSEAMIILKNYRWLGS